AQVRRWPKLTRGIGAPAPPSGHTERGPTTSVCCASPGERAWLLPLGGRVAVPFRCGTYQEARLDRIRGQADLLYRNGTCFLAGRWTRRRRPRPRRRTSWV